jgi:hypothetical protein
MPNETTDAPAPRPRVTEADIHVALAALGLVPYLAWCRPDLVSPGEIHELPNMAVVA